MPKHYAPIAGVNAEEFVGELPGWLFSTVKYIWRAPNKNGVEDVIKALDCLDRYIGDTVEFHLSPSAKAAEADEVIGFISAIAHSELTENQKERLIVELLKQLDETLLKFREYVVGAKEGIEKNL
jgi:hypothetical protein